MDLPQSEADALLGMAKVFETTATINLSPGVKDKRRLASDDGTESFMLDINASRVKLIKYSYHHRSRSVIPLARLCINGAGHQNPDFTVISGLHFHRYVEGFGDKYAQELDSNLFSSPNDRVLTMQEFCKFINILNTPTIFARSELRS